MFNFIKGMAFTMAMFTALLLGFAMGKNNAMDEVYEEDDENTVQDAVVEEI